MKKKRGSRDGMFQKRVREGKHWKNNVGLGDSTHQIKHSVLLLAIRDDRMPLKAFLGV